MKLNDAIEKLGKKKATNIAISQAKALNIQWEDGISAVFNAIAIDPDRAPKNIGGKNDDKTSVIKKWIEKYQRGKKGKSSERTSNPPGTIPDPIVETIIGARLTDLTGEDLKRITYAHRLAMSSENILGLILEEYLAANIEAYDWHCAWGETVKSVDFVHKDGRLLQIKNRSNSENSSSSSVREGTNIKKWFRIKADRIEYMWTDLNEICGTTCLSEEAFIKFVQMTIANNPSCLAVENNNPWT